MGEDPREARSGGDHERDPATDRNLRISDNGIGIDKDVQAKLFETQFSTKSRHEGTGLGLNISRRFVRAIGGDIYLESSQPNEGAVFMVKLPCLKGDSQAGAA